MLENDMIKAYDSVRNLEDAVLADAKARAERIISDARRAEKEALDGAENEAVKRAEEYKKEQMSAIDTAVTDRLSQKAEQSRTALFGKRKEISDAVFEKVRERLISYASSDGYGSYIASRLEAIANTTGADSVRIQVSGLAADNNAVKKYFPDAHTERIPYDVIGGVIVYDTARDIAYDLTLDSALTAERSEFLRVSGLRISD